MISDETDEIIEKKFNSLKNRYQNDFQSIRGCEFVFDYVQFLYYKRHKINLNRGGSYIDSSDWIKTKKAAINPITKKDNKCFQYAKTVWLNFEEIGKHAERIKIYPSVNIYNQEGINYPSEKMIGKNVSKTM